MNIRLAIRNFRKFIKALPANALNKKRRFVRLTWWQSPSIWFFDKADKSVFSVASRHYVDSLTADEIYTKHNYNLARLSRYDSICATYQEIIAAGKVPLIIDCGANSGLASRYFAKEFPNAKIIGIEPDQGNVDIARENCKQFENVAIKQAAIGAKAGFANIQNQAASANAIRVELSDQPTGIAITTIDDIIRQLAIDDSENTHVLFMVKVDIEGFEDDLFSSNLGWIADLPLLSIELHDWMLPNEGKSRNFLKAVSEYDRDFVYIEDNVYSIKN